MNGWSKCTKVQLIALEAVTELGPVDLENPPVLREMMFTNAKSDGWGAEDVAKDTVVEFFPVLVDPIKQSSKCLHRVLGLVQRPATSESRSGPLLPSQCRQCWCPSPSNLFPPALNRDAVLFNPEFDLIDDVGEDSLAGQDDVSGRRAGVANVVDVGFL